MKILVSSDDMTGKSSLQKFSEENDISTLFSVGMGSQDEVNTILRAGPSDKSYSAVSALLISEGRFSDGDVLYLDSCGNLFKLTPDERDSMATTEEYSLSM